MCSWTVEVVGVVEAVVGGCIGSYMGNGSEVGVRTGRGKGSVNDVCNRE